MEWSTEIGALATALAKAQGQMKAAAKDASNEHFKSRYADLASIWEACRAPLAAAELAVLQQTRLTPDGLELVTTLAHSSGQWVRSAMPVRAARPDPQSLGSALTYARRYSLAAMVGVAPDDDDDGNAASGHGQTPASQRQPPQGQAKQQGQGRAQPKGQGQQQRKPPADDPAPSGDVDATVIASWVKRIQAPRDLAGLKQVWADFDKAVAKGHPLRAATKEEWAAANERLKRAESDARRPNPQRAGD